MRSELALDLAPPSAGETRKLPGDHGESKLEDYVRRLEEERRKIEGFRRELPFCISIISEKIERLKEELAECRRGGRSEEFIAPVLAKVEDSEAATKDDKDFRDKVNWMSSAQLWSDNHSANTSSTTDASSCNGQKNQRERAAEDPAGGRGGFFPFKEMKGEAAADLFLLSPTDKDHCSPNSISREPIASTSQASRKPRRCWSPELHRRFVKSLQQLGGAHAATPKQIRELMKVDGLTNDEVKSHLQKYRLHTRRAPSASSEKRPAMLMGGLWPPAEKRSNGSPQGPLHMENEGEDSGDEDEGRSESFNWKGRLHRINGEDTD